MENDFDGWTVRRQMLNEYDTMVIEHDNEMARQHGAFEVDLRGYQAEIPIWYNHEEVKLNEKPMEYDEVMLPGRHYDASEADLRGHRSDIPMDDNYNPNSILEKGMEKISLEENQCIATEEGESNKEVDKMLQDGSDNDLLEAYKSYQVHATLDDSTSDQYILESYKIYQINKFH